MKTLIFCIFFTGITLGISAQNITISFQAKVSGTSIDSIIVTNQRTNQKVKLLENESLNLTTVTGVNISSFPSGEEYLYPNPCNGNTEVIFATHFNQEVKVNVYNISGQLLSSKSQFLMPGQHRYKISFPEAGIFNMSVLKNDGTIGYKAVCLNPTINKCGIEYLGTENKNLIKSAVVEKTLNYALGDILNCSAYSGKNNIIIADSPTVTKKYFVDFYECIDVDKKSYKVVKIGDQVWMAENLRAIKYNDGTSIPNVTDNSAWVALTTGAYCFYNNDTVSYQKLYGALYNWYAVNTGKLCPSGWHVPSNAELTTLENYLISNGYNYDGTISGNKYAKSLASATIWSCGSTYAELPGFNLTANNKSGFSFLPGGERRSNDGTFSLVGASGLLWSFTEIKKDIAAICWMLHCCNADVLQPGLEEKFGLSVRCLRDL